MGSSRRRHRFEPSELLESLNIVPTQAGEDNGFITRSLAIKGNLVAETDLFVQGLIEGNISAPDYQLRIGRAGRVKGEVTARIIIVEGEVNGTLHATETVTLCGSASLQGNISAPQVEMEKGAKFNGKVRMDVVPMSLTSTRTRHRIATDS